MPDPQPHPEWQAEQHRTAQEAAVEWAARAEDAATAALRSEAFVKENSGQQYLRDSVAEERVNGQEHQARSATARQLAEMWTRVAVALAPPQTTVTYDLNVVGIDHTNAAEALKHLDRAARAAGLGRPRAQGVR